MNKMTTANTKRTIQVEKTTAEALKSIKIVPNESYDNIIQRLLEDKKKSSKE
jgi:predicted CopG family antitoxin